MDANLYLLFGKARALVLAAFHDAVDEGTPLHLREIARRTGLSPTAVQYELRLLRQLDMLKDIGTSTRPLYVLNREHQLFDDLRKLFTHSGTATLLTDDAHFAAKRAQQHKDRRTSSAKNSPFLRGGRRA
jgi:hypothetical protein